MPQLAAAQYGKENIRVYKVMKDEKTDSQSVVEMTVSVLLKGDIEASYVVICYPSFPSHMLTVLVTQKPIIAS